MLIHQIYLFNFGVTLDRTLTFKKDFALHYSKRPSNTLPNKSLNSKWGASADIIRTTTLSFSGEHVCPVWQLSKHTKTLNTSLNKALRKIARCHTNIYTEDTLPGRYFFPYI